MVQRLRFLIAPVLLAGALAACGGGGGATDGVATLSNSESGEATVTTLSSGDTEKALLEWVTCMRGEGVDVPDPTVDADGNLTLRPGNQGGERSGDQQAGPPDRDSLQAATTTCGNPPEGALGFNEEDRQSFQESALKLSQCMRDQGITDFPDPDFSNFGPGAGPSQGDDAPAGPFGDVDMDDPKVQAAMQTCRKQLSDSGVELPGGGPGGPPGSGAVD